MGCFFTIFGVLDQNRLTYIEAPTGGGGNREFGVPNTYKNVRFLREWNRVLGSKV